MNSEHAKAITILELAEFILGRKARTGIDFEEAGLAMVGGCEICRSVIAAYSACPSKSGYWRCQNGCIGDFGWYDVVEAKREIFD